MPGVIVLDNLVRAFGEHVVLDRVSLQIEPGERVVLRGPNGSGKTTLLRCILGTLLPSNGTVTVSGHPAGSIAARREVGASLSLERSFYLRLSGIENLVLFARLRGLERSAARSEVSALVEELELAEFVGARADRCSTGQLQQLSLARSLLGSPSVLILDEPTRSLDSDARGRLWKALERRTDSTVLVATHLDEDEGHGTRTIAFPISSGEGDRP